MSIMLPDWLEWVLNEMLGMDWPTADEDKLIESAEHWRQFAQDVQQLQYAGVSSAGNVISENYGDSIDGFKGTWDKFSGNGSGYLDDAQTVALVVAGVLDAAAAIVIAGKAAVIVQLAILAAEIIAAQAAAPFTFGLSELAVAGMTQATRLIVRRILKELKEALIEAVVEAMKEPAISALEAMITDLITQSLNVNFGAQKSIDVGQTIKTGADAAVEQIKNTPQTIAEGLRDGLGERAGRHVHNAAGHGSDGHGSDGDSDDGDSGSADGRSADGSDSSSSSSSSPNANGNASPNSNSDSNTDTSSSPNNSDTNTNTNRSPDSTPGNNGSPDSTPTNTPAASNSPDSSPTPTSTPTPSPAVASTPDSYTPSPFDPPAATSPTPSTGGGVASSPIQHTSSSDSFSGPNPTTYTPASHATGSSDSSSVRTVSDSFTGPDLSQTYTPSHQSPDPGTHAAASPASGMPSGPNLDSAGPAPSSRPATAGPSTPTATPAGGSPLSAPNVSAAGTPSPSSSPSTPPRTSAPASTPVTGPNTGTGTGTPSRSTIPSATPTTTPGTSPSAGPSAGPSTSTSTPHRDTSPAATPTTTTSAATTTSPNPTTGTGTPTGSTTPHSTPTSTPGTSPNANPSTPSPSSSSTPTRTPTPASTPVTGTNPSGSTTPSTSSTPNRATTPVTTPTPTPSTNTSPSPSSSPAATPAAASTPSTTPTPSNGTPSNSGASTSTSTPGRNTPPSAPPTPGTTPTPATPQTPSAQTPSTQTPAQQSPSTPPTPPNAQSQPNAQNPQTPQNPQNQQTVPPPVHLHAGIPAQNTGGGSQHNQPGGTPQGPPRPASDSRPYDQPGGVEGPRPDDQNNLEASVLRDDNGDPVRHPDPNDGSWTQNINGTDPSEPGRNNNCVDTALSTVDTYSGNPTAAASRTPDTDADGNPSDRGETGGRDRIEDTLGAKFSDMGNGKDAFTNLESTLRDSGHGSQAVIITSDANGRAHAWNAVNHNGDITYIDAQTGQRSNTPLHNGDNGVFAIPLDPNRRPVTPSAPTSDAGSNRPADSRPQTTERRPAAEPGHSPDPDAMDVDETGADHDHDHDMADADDHEDDDEPSRVSDPEDPDSEQYGIEPDPSQAALRESHDVHRVDLDRVHQRLNDWAADGSLAGVMQDAVGATNGPNQGSDGPTTFTKSELSQRLEGFDRLSQGEQLAALSAMGRLSAGFHGQHGVGSSPESVAHPYRAAGEPAATVGTTDSAAKNADGSLGAKAHKKTGDNYLTGYKSDVINNSEHIWEHGPDFTERNYAVIEMTGPDGETHYVVDSSVPPGEKNVSGRHSEKHLLDWVDRVNEGKSANQQYKPTGLYTEREPCGQGAGHAKCSDQLSQRLGADVPVYYSTTYRTDPADVEAGKVLDAEKRDHIKAIKTLPIAEVREQVQQRFEDRYGADSGRAQKMATSLVGMSDDQAREALKKAIDSDYKKIKEGARSDNVMAMGKEMEDHLSALESTWKKMGGQLV